MNNQLPTVICLLPSVFAPLHLSRTLYKSALFMQNKANLMDALMNVSPVITREYKNKSNWKLGENKANSNPTCRGVAPAASPPRRGEAGSNPKGP